MPHSVTAWSSYKAMNLAHRTEQGPLQDKETQNAENKRPYNGCDICSHNEIRKRKLSKELNSAATETVSEAGTMLEKKDERKNK